jgi:hypothetical protein
LLTNVSMKEAVETAHGDYASEERHMRNYETIPETTPLEVLHAGSLTSLVRQGLSR